jgi:hypothetical protein
MTAAKADHKLNVNINIEIIDGLAYEALCLLICNLYIICIKDGAILSFLESTAAPDSVMSF